MTYGSFTKSQSESSQQISTVDMPTISQAEAYFAGRKQMTLEQFRTLFIIREVNNSSKALLYGNQ